MITNLSPRCRPGSIQKTSRWIPAYAGMTVFVILAIFMMAGCKVSSASDKFLNIQEITSPGGITAWLVEDHSLPIIAMEFAFAGAGAALDPEDKQGLARLASNTMDEGAGDYDSQRFQKTLTDNSITLHFGASRDDFTGSLKTLSRKKDLAFNLMRLALTEARFDQDPVDRMRAANMARIRSSLSNPEWIAARLENDIAFAGHPYAMNSGGTLSTLQNVTPDDLRSFVQNRLTKDRLFISVVGDISAKDLKTVLDDVFSKLPATGNKTDIPDLTVQNGGKTFLYEKDIPQTIIEIIQPGISRDDPDYHAFQVMNFIFGGSGFGSRLTEEVREKRGLTYGIYSHAVLMDHLKAYAIITSTKNSSVAESMALIKQEMNKIKNEPINDKELANAKSYITGSLPLSLTSTSGIAGLALSLQLNDRPIDYLDTLSEKINAITIEDVQRVAQKIMKPDELTVIMVGKPESITPDQTIDTIPNVE